MPKFYTSVILLINQSKEIGEKQFSVFGSRGDQNSPLMHIPLCIMDFVDHGGITLILIGRSAIQLICIYNVYLGVPSHSIA